jgi:hypothetical protein
MGQPPPPSYPPPGQYPQGQQPGYGQQPGQPPGYGQQPGYGAPPTKSGGGKVVGIIAGVVAAVVLLCGGGVGVLFATGILGGGDPEQTVRDLYAAARDSDCNRMIDLFTEESWNEGGTVTRQEAVADCEESMAITGGLPYNVRTRLISQDRNEAVVEANYYVPAAGSEDGGTERITLRRVGGEWLVHDP